LHLFQTSQPKVGVCFGCAAISWNRDNNWLHALLTYEK
jgi:hypothetical protein